MEHQLIAERLAGLKAETEALDNSARYLKAKVYADLVVYRIATAGDTSPAVQLAWHELLLVEYRRLEEAER